MMQIAKPKSEGGTGKDKPCTCVDHLMLFRGPDYEDRATYFPSSIPPQSGSCRDTEDKADNDFRFAYGSMLTPLRCADRPVVGLGLQ